MRYLIDTSVFVKMTIDTVSDGVRDIIEDCENIIYVCSESVKEFVHLVQNNNKDWI